MEVIKMVKLDGQKSQIEYACHSHILQSSSTVTDRIQ